MDYLVFVEDLMRLVESNEGLVGVFAVMAVAGLGYVAKRLHGHERNCERYRMEQKSLSEGLKRSVDDNAEDIREVKKDVKEVVRLLLERKR